MDFRNCENCNKPFKYSGYGAVLCPICKKKDEEDFETVKDFLLKNPLSTGEEVFKATGVTAKTISKWLRDERFIMPQAINIGLKCEKCGEPIYKGKLCDNCKRQLAMGMMFPKSDTAEKGSVVQKNEHMRFLGKRK